MSSILKNLKSIWYAFISVPKSKTIDTLEWEVAELEHLFALLAIGSFAGIPSPPMQISLELLPDMEKEFNLMMNKIDVAHSPLSELFSVLDVS